MRPEPTYVTDIIGEVVDAVQTEVLEEIKANEIAVKGSTAIQGINFQFGHYNELIEILISYDKSPTKSLDKYPLIWLRTDFRERKGQDIGMDSEVFLNIIICHFTKQEIRSTQRLTNVFKPVLYPLYGSLLNQMFLHERISHWEAGLVPHDKYDRYYWGTSQVGKTTDYVDAIEIDNLALKINIQDC